jgi:hypothetical protein
LIAFNIDKAGKNWLSVVKYRNHNIQASSFASRRAVLVRKLTLHTKSFR